MTPQKFATFGEGASKVSEELRVNALATGGEELVDMIAPHLFGALNKAFEAAPDTAFEPPSPAELPAPTPAIEEVTPERVPVAETTRRGRSQ